MSKDNFNLAELGLHDLNYKAKVAIIMGSKSDYDIMAEVVYILEEFSIEHEVLVVSAHRTPERMLAYAKVAKERGLQVIIAGAGGAAHLPGMIASMTTVPVIGVPINATVLNGLDSLLSIVQMPFGVPVATMAIGKAGAKNAGLFAISLLANNDQELSKKLIKWRQSQTDKIPSSPK